MQSIQTKHNASYAKNHGNEQNNITPRYKEIPPLSEKQIRLFWKHVDRRGPNECWLWKGTFTTGKWGSKYGIWRTGKPSQAFRPHRVAYTLLVGPIPDGLTLDHLKESKICTSSLCCNPAHCEPVTQGVNTSRYRASLPRICKRGHQMLKQGICRKCVQITRAEWDKKQQSPLQSAAIPQECK